MSDSQWPRWEVFKQDTPNKPYQAVGSVHAADPEHALLNARNVFVRRPQAISLWAVPADAIFSITEEELEKSPDWQEKIMPEDTPAIRYEIFRKTSHRRSMTFVEHVGGLEAATPKHALQQAIAVFDDQPALAWWVVPAAAIVRTEPDAAPSWFEPATDKTYKQQSAYGFVRPRRGK
ncbi:MAG: hypothetical protein KC419_27360 [Anaerolineales bacterium]|nr:hypothetical protein [Anaerolineales bacterium]